MRNKYIFIPVANNINTYYTSTSFIQGGLYHYIDNYSFDWVELYDGANSSSTLIGGKMCGHKLPPPILSSTNEILIKFKSDNTVERSGYKIRAEAVGKTNSKQKEC